jgi:hypothetical protein
MHHGRHTSGGCCEISRRHHPARHDHGIIPAAFLPTHLTTGTGITDSRSFTFGQLTRLADPPDPDRSQSATLQPLHRSHLRPGHDPSLRLAKPAADQHIHPPRSLAETLLYPLLHPAVGQPRAEPHRRRPGGRARGFDRHSNREDERRLRRRGARHHHELQCEPD